MKVAISVLNYAVLLAGLVGAELLWIYHTFSFLAFAAVLVVTGTLSRFAFTRRHRVAKKRWPRSYRTDTH
jgi:hypothetical protein